MTVREFKKKILKADHQEVEAWLLLVDTLHDFRQALRHGSRAARKALPAFARHRNIGWKDRHVRRGTALAAVRRSHGFLSCQTEEARGLILDYAGQILRYDGKVRVRTKEAVHDEVSGSWKSALL